MNEKGMNGAPNPARSLAISAMMILCISLMIFFVTFARKFAMSRFWKTVIQVFGTISMVFASLIFTEHHDIMTTLSSIFGFFVVIGVIWEIYRSKLDIFKFSGTLFIVFLAINNYIYYTKNWIEYLPIIQKITFALVLMWIIGLNYELTKEKYYDNNFQKKST
jgi:hypothetical protein